MVTAGVQWAVGAAAQREEVRIGAPAGRSRVPAMLRQGEFLAPQSISALDVSGKANLIAVATMGFRHDRNFFLVSGEGKVLWGRYVGPWAPFQVSALPGGKAFAMGLAYSRQTQPYPAISLFQDESSPEIAQEEDVLWDRATLRYGRGDWRTGWTPSIVGDLLVRRPDAVLTTQSHRASGWQLSSTGEREAYRPGSHRPFRMAASGDGKVLAYAYIVPDASRLDAATRKRLSVPPGVAALRQPAAATDLWRAAPMADQPAVAPPPEPAGEFPELVDEFNMRPQTFVPFRAAMSVALNEDGTRVALTEYGGALRLQAERAIGNWTPHGQGVSFCPRQRGWLRLLGPDGKEIVRAALPREGLFDARINARGDRIWCAPTSWFARGLAGCPWLPADSAADAMFVYDVANKSWETWQFPDAVSDLAVHPTEDRALVSCWDGNVYLLRADGTPEATIAAGGPARLRWNLDGSFAVAGTQAGELLCLGPEGKLRWKTALPVRPVPPLKEAVQPVFPEVPIYAVGRTGPEHAYVGDIWLIKTDQGGILVDVGGTSAIPLTWQRIREAGVDPKNVRHVLLSHSHGDHSGALYLWRTQGVEVVAAASAAFAVTWVFPTWSGYGIWVPTPIDRPLPLKRIGDETEFTLLGQRIRAIFAPGHSPDSTIYAMEIAGKRVVFTGDIAFDDRRADRPLGSNIVHRCWGDTDKARRVIKVIEEKVMPFRPDFEFKGHRANRDPLGSWRRILEASHAAMTGE